MIALTGPVARAGSWSAHTRCPAEEILSRCKVLCAHCVASGSLRLKSRPRKAAHRPSGVAFRFANGPVESELTGPSLTPDEETRFVNAQHPGELTGSFSTSAAEFGVESTYNSWWPEGNKTAGDNPSTPKPSTVAISATRRGGERSRFIPRRRVPTRTQRGGELARRKRPPRSSALPPVRPPPRSAAPRAQTTLPPARRPVTAALARAAATRVRISMRRKAFAGFIDGSRPRGATALHHRSHSSDTDT